MLPPAFGKTDGHSAKLPYLALVFSLFTFSFAVLVLVFRVGNVGCLQVGWGSKPSEVPSAPGACPRCSRNFRAWEQLAPGLPSADSQDKLPRLLSHYAIHTQCVPQSMVHLIHDTDGAGRQQVLDRRDLRASLTYLIRHLGRFLSRPASVLRWMHCAPGGLGYDSNTNLPHCQPLSMGPQTIGVHKWNRRAWGVLVGATRW